MLQVFFAGPYKSRCILVDESSAQAGIIDIDGYGGEALYQSYRHRFPSLPLILLSLSDREIPGAISLRKPLKMQQFMETIDLLHQQLTANVAVSQDSGFAPAAVESIQTENAEVKSVGQGQTGPTADKGAAKKTAYKAAALLDELEVHNYIGSAPDIDPHDAEQLARVQYKPEEYLVGHLSAAIRKADTSGACIRLDTPTRFFLIWHETDLILVGKGAERLRAQASVPLTGGKILVATSEEMNRRDSAAEDLLLTREALLWQTALWAARGRVPLGSSLHTPVRLHRWPNMTRLLLFPNAMRIAALWIAQPISLLETARHLRISQRFVFSFYSAAVAIGLTQPVRNSENLLVESPQLQPARRHGLLRRILDRLRG